MILSFHPCCRADRHIICAGRMPDESDRKAIQAADAVILPQGCTRELYLMANRHCRLVFPNYHARFAYPGKLGQIQLFRKYQAPHPSTSVFETTGAFDPGEGPSGLPEGFDFPIVFKFNWGGEGSAVFCLRDQAALSDMLRRAEAFEKSGYCGFMLQEFVRSEPCVLRVVVIHDLFISYWKWSSDEAGFGRTDPGRDRFDHDADPDMQAAGIACVKAFCRDTGINLAGFDMIFPKNAESASPLFLEINYFFGRRGLGGSDRYYSLLNDRVDRWLAAMSVTRRHRRRMCSS